MSTKRAAKKNAAQKNATKKTSGTPKERAAIQPEIRTQKLSQTEEDLLAQLEHGYQLETDSLGSNPVLRKPGMGEEIRPASAGRNTVQALKKRGLIVEDKGDDPLKIVWKRV